MLVPCAEVDVAVTEVAFKGAGEDVVGFGVVGRNAYNL
jgi:hypothetical protein